MKKVKLFFLCFVLVLSNAYSSDFCHTEINKPVNFKRSFAKSASANQHYCLRLYIHIVRRSDGTGGQTLDDIQISLNYLKDNYAAHNISFFWDGYVDYIDNNYFYGGCSKEIFSVNNHSDGIDVYYFDDDASATSQANGIGESSELCISGRYLFYVDFEDVGISHTRSGVISHEMGHVLTLLHTHYGTRECKAGDENCCPELVDGSNSDICGDYLSDTPADTGIGDVVTHPDSKRGGCKVLDSYKKYDENDDEYQPDTWLIMSYSHPYCKDTFSLMQAQQMRDAIANLPFLQKTLVNKSPDCPTDITITNSVPQGQLEIYFASNTITSTQKINSYGEAYYSAPEVILNEGFVAEFDSELQINTQGCVESQKEAESYPVRELKSLQFEMYPNPASGNFTIEIKNASADLYYVEVINLQGKLIYKERFNGLYHTINLGDNVKGAYLVNLYNAHKNKVEMIMIK